MKAVPYPSFEKFMGGGSFRTRLDVDHLISDLAERVAEARSKTYYVNGCRSFAISAW